MKMRFFALITAIILYFIFQSFISFDDSSIPLKSLERMDTQDPEPYESKKIKIVKSLKQNQMKKIVKPQQLKKPTKKSLSATNKEKSLKYLRSQNLVTFSNWKGFAIFDNDIIIGKLSDPSLKNGAIEPNHPIKWSSPTIGYHFHPKLPSETKEIIKEAFQYFTSKTPLRFTTSIKEGDSFLHFVPVDEDGKCASFLGRQEGGQSIFLGKNCNRNSVLHEVMHALGFIHEHSRFDRDQFIAIEWENIKDEKWDQFAFIPQVYTLREQLDDFDAKSRMIYPPLSFSKNGKPTIISLNKDHYFGPVEDGLSANDIQRLQYYFE